MPNLNGTGPEGRGPLTGRRMGNCREKKSSDKESTENQDAIYGRGRGGRSRGGGFGFWGGRRRGFGRGRGFGFGKRRDSNDESQNTDE